MFVGDQRVTEATLDGYVDGEVSSYLEQGATLEEVSYADSRQKAAFIVLFAELGQAMDLEAPDTSSAANEFEAQYIEAAKYYDEIAAAAEPREMTDVELEALNSAVSGDQNLLQRAVEGWIASEGLTEEELMEFNMAAQSDPTVLQEVVQLWGEQQAGFADDLNEYIAEYDVAVNPRYGELDISPLVGVFTVEVPQR
ncbi:hypothetical protein O1R50_18610 [Glycomyces luteolus]|uniref:Uncharacterized protein n=1 Tax=Glycomyces luteolus TaxID=2670330 RepID=A0A9X3SRP7_9ACTN|nr:hypothetical protein [Glycomyces luteolus]MDA1361646.1 hypothetical protein [Glycomyces luteolus]